LRPAIPTPLGLLATEFVGELHVDVEPALHRPDFGRVREDEVLFGTAHRRMQITQVPDRRNIARTDVIGEVLEIPSKPGSDLIIRQRILSASSNLEVRVLTVVMEWAASDWV